MNSGLNSFACFPPKDKVLAGQTPHILCTYFFRVRGCICHFLKQWNFYRLRFTYGYIVSGMPLQHVLFGIKIFFNYSFLPPCMHVDRILIYLRTIKSNRRSYLQVSLLKRISFCKCGSCSWWIYGCFCIFSCYIHLYLLYF